MTPAAAIAMLDRQIAKHGQTITLRRVVVNAPAIEAAVRGFVRGYKPDEMTDDIKQGTSLVVISPTALAGTPFATALPKASDKVTISGRLRNIDFPEPVEMDDKLVRLNLQVSG